MEKVDGVSLIAVVGVAGTLFGIVFGYLGYQKGVKTDSYKNGSYNATLRTDTEYIKHRIDDVLLEQKETNKSFNALAERVTRVEESAKSVWKRVDILEKNNSDKS